MAEATKNDVRRYDYEVHMQRRSCFNAAQMARRCVVYLRATDQDEAMQLANRLPDKQAFKAVSARRVY